MAIIRGSLAHSSIATVDYTRIIKGLDVDVRLEPGDIVYVPFAPYRELALFAENILYQFVQTIAVNEGIRAVSPNAARGTVNRRWGSPCQIGLASAHVLLAPSEAIPLREDNPLRPIELRGHHTE